MTKEQDDRLTTLRRRVAKINDEPGVYRWLDKDGNVMYVGKAKSLRNRMKSYVQDGPKRSAWMEIMVRQIADFDVTVVRSELEALILESNLIKELKPKYNIMLKDDKGYAYVRMTLQDPYPTVEIVRQLTDDGSKYFGPFLGAWGPRQTLDMLDGILKFRACKKSLDALNHPPKGGISPLHTPCLDYQIGKCCGLCIGAVSQADYNARIDEIASFFRGNFASVKKRAKEQMQILAKDQKFERAAKIRDVVRFIEELEEKQVVSDTSGENADIFGIAIRNGRIQAVLFRQRDGRLIEQMSFGLKGEAETPAEALEQFLPQYYGDTQDIPDIIVIQEDISEREVFETWLREKRGKVVRVVVPERGKKSKLLEMAEKNAQEKVEQQFTAWEAEAKKVENALTELGTLLGLPAAPKRIEGYDISHLGGTATVGSMVVMVNGKPKREHYRSFNIKTLASGDIDDYKSLGEVLRRRLRYIAESTAKLEEKLAAVGIEIRKLRKGDAEKAKAMIGSLLPAVDLTPFDTKECYGAFRAEDMIGIGWMHTAKGEQSELLALHATEHAPELRRVLLPKLIKSFATAKVYAVIDPLLEEEFADAGFRHVLTAPECVLKHVDKASNQICVMYEAKKNKPDDSFLSVPDLLLIDGGKGQLGVIVDVLKDMGLTIPVAGLAKREEEIFLPGNPVSLLVKEGSQPRFLLQRLRDEAHRFANDRRERRLTAALTASKLDDIPGIGDAAKIALTKKFGSADQAIAANDAELATVLSVAQLKALRQKFPA